MQAELKNAVPRVVQLESVVHRVMGELVRFIVREHRFRLAVLAEIIGDLFAQLLDEERADEQDSQPVPDALNEVGDYWEKQWPDFPRGRGSIEELFNRHGCTPEHVAFLGALYQMAARLLREEAAQLRATTAKEA